MNKNDRKRFDTIETLIGTDTAFTGDIISGKTIRIDGKLTGNIEDSDGVIVGCNAEIKGNIKTKYIIVGGTVQGNIIAKDGIELLNKSKTVGDIKTTILSICEGAVFEGKSSMIEEEKYAESEDDKLNTKD